MLATLLEVLGFVLVVVAAWFVSLPLALFVAGAGLIIGAQSVTKSADPTKPRRRRRTTA